VRQSAPFVPSVTQAGALSLPHAIGESNLHANPRRDLKSSGRGGKWLKNQQLAEEAGHAQDRSQYPNIYPTRESLSIRIVQGRREEEQDMLEGPHGSHLLRMQLTIEKLVYGGDGLARLPADASGKGKAVFLPFVLAGEEIAGTLTEQKPGFARGRLDAVVRPSAERVSPPCPYFGTCGGCHYQHATYPEQLRIKTEILRENLRRLANLVLPVEIQVHASAPWNYRNRTRMALRREPGFALGYRRMGSEQILAVETCPISSPLLQKAVTALWTLGRNGQVPASLREIELLANGDDTRLLLNLFRLPETAKPEASLESFTSQLRAVLPELETIALFAERQHHRKGQEPEDAKPQILAGSGFLTYVVSRHSYQVSAGAFFQSNRHLIPTLVEIVTKGRSGGTALDLYAGGGLFSLPLAAQYQSVAAVESSPASFRDLRRNLPPNARAVRATAEAYLRNASKKLPPDLIVVDPPRAGLGAKAARTLADCRAPRVTYVSCDPATLARDLAVLIAAGYRVEDAHLLDLFPETYHLETILHLVLP
jgi:23S rRNA (uracil1939-C5)-methyltransferase